MFKKYVVVIFSIFITLSVQAQYGGLEGIANPDKDADFKVESSEMKYWSGDVAYYYARGYGKSYFGKKLNEFVQSFDENRDGRLSTLEFRRFQTGAKKLFSEAYDVITTKYDENRNRRLDKEEKVAARTEIESFLQFSLNVEEYKKNGDSTKEIVNKDRAIDDIYD